MRALPDFEYHSHEEGFDVVRGMANDGYHVLFLDEPEAFFGGIVLGAYGSALLEENLAERHVGVSLAGEAHVEKPLLDTQLSVDEFVVEDVGALALEVAVHTLVLRVNAAHIVERLGVREESTERLAETIEVVGEVFLYDAPLLEFGLDVLEGGLGVPSADVEVLDVKSLPEPHHEGVATLECDVAGCVAGPALNLRRIEEALHVEEFDDVLTGGLVVPVTLKVTGALLVGLLCKVCEVVGVREHQFQVFLQSGADECHGLDEHPLLVVPEFGVCLIPEGINDVLALLIHLFHCSYTSSGVSPQ